MWSLSECRKFVANYPEATALIFHMCANGLSFDAAVLACMESKEKEVKGEKS